MLKNAQGRHAWAALACFAFAEASFFPIPPDVMLLPMMVANRRRAFALAAWCTLFSVLGGAMGYAIGALFWDTAGQWIIHALHIPLEKVEHYRQSFAAHAYTDARRVGLVHLAPAMVAGLLAALAEIPEWGFERAARLVTHCRESLLAAGVEVRTEAGQGTLISFRVPGDPAQLVKDAEAKEVVIRNLPDGWLRASVGWWNDEGDVERLVAFLQDQARS